MDEQQFLKALGPLASLYSEPDFAEILVDSPERVLVERRMAGLEQTDVHFNSVEELVGTILAVLDACGSPRQPGQSVCEMSIPGAGGRGLAVFPPVALHNPTLVLRKMYTRQVTWDDLLKFGAVSQQVKDFFASAMRAPVNLLVAGGTASGKTTLASRILELIPPEQRLVAAESWHEFSVEHPRVVFLEAAGSGLSFQEVILTATKMRPDWLAVGEMTGTEALTTLEVFGRGHSGLTTIHASSALDALARLETMCLSANFGLGLDEIRNVICSALQLIVYQQRLKNGRRRVIEVVELRNQQDGRYLLEPLFRYNEAADQMEQVGQPSF